MRRAILSVRGTFGSGKTTAVREFMTRYPTTELRNSAGKIMGYKCDASAALVQQPIFIVGKYDNVCGGTDSIKTQDEIAERIHKAHARGHVLFEGALVSASGLAGAVTQSIHPTGCDVYAFLNTPEELCIERVKGRRAAAGNAKPFDPVNLVDKFKSVVNCYRNLKAAGGFDVRVINYTDPHPSLVQVFWEFEQ